MPLPLCNVVQRRHIPDSKRRRSMHVHLSRLDGRSEVYPSLFSLFTRLPVELQIEIFAHCLPLFPQFDPMEAPLLFSRVCRSWRSLVLSVPKFWSSFKIEITGSALPTLLRDSDSFIERSMKLWLARSKNHPLTLSIVHLPVGRTPDNRSARLLALLIPEAHRWRSVEFIVPSTNMISLPSDFPYLQSFTLHLKGLWQLELSMNLSIANIPWRQLSQLDLQLERQDIPTLGDALSILSQAPALRLCKISVECGLESGVDPDNFQLPVLEELDLILHNGSASGTSALWQFFDLISMPTLRALSITWLDPPPTLWPGCQPFMPFLRRISLTLRILNLAYPPVSETDLIEILTPFSEVTHLRLRFSFSDLVYDPVSDHLLSLLTLRSPLTAHSEASPPLLPSLIALDLQCNGSAFSNTALLAMVKSRWKKDSDPGNRFSHLWLLSLKPILQGLTKQVQLLRDEGFDMSVDSLLLM